MALTFWYCCNCDDGPKYLSLRPACIHCHHLPCASCRVVIKDPPELTGSRQPTCSSENPEPFAPLPPHRSQYANTDQITTRGEIESLTIAAFEAHNEKYGKKEKKPDRIHHTTTSSPARNDPTRQAESAGNQRGRVEAWQRKEEIEGASRCRRQDEAVLAAQERETADALMRQLKEEEHAHRQSEPGRRRIDEEVQGLDDGVRRLDEEARAETEALERARIVRERSAEMTAALEREIRQVQKAEGRSEVDANRHGFSDGLAERGQEVMAEARQEARRRRNDGVYEKQDEIGLTGTIPNGDTNQMILDEDDEEEKWPRDVTFLNPGPSLAEWNAQKDRIMRLYVEVNLTLEEVMSIMRQEEGLVATEETYKKKIHAWGFEKSWTIPPGRTTPDGDDASRDDFDDTVSEIAFSDSGYGSASSSSSLSILSTAADEIANDFVGNQDLKAILSHLLGADAASNDQWRHILVSSLQTYSADLKRNAGSQLDKDAYRLVRSRAPYLAWTIISRLGHSLPPSQFENLHHKHVDKSKLLEDFLARRQERQPEEQIQKGLEEEHSDDEEQIDSMPNLKQMKKFLFNGYPFVSFLTKLKELSIAESVSQFQTERVKLDIKKQMVGEGQGGPSPEGVPIASNNPELHSDELKAGNDATLLEVAFGNKPDKNFASSLSVAAQRFQFQHASEATSETKENPPSVIIGELVATPNSNARPSTGASKQVLKPGDGEVCNYAEVFSLQSEYESTSVEHDPHDDGQIVTRSTERCPVPKFQVWTNYFGPIYRVPLWISKGFEPLIEHGMHRIRWTCACGTRMYDDYRELVPGAARALERQLNDNYRAANNGSRSGGGQMSAASSASRASSVSFVQRMYGWFKRAREESLPTTRQTCSAMQAPPSTIENSNSLFLLLCAHLQMRPETKLVQGQMDNLKSDQDLFGRLKDLYDRKCHRTGLGSLFSVWKVQDIRFVQFELLYNDLVNDLIPTVENAWPNSAEYELDLTECKTHPPIAGNILTHLLENPHCADPHLFLTKRVPRKRKEELRICQIKRNARGWGLYLAPGVDWTKVSTIGLLFLLLSMAFGVLWSVFRSVSEGFQVTSCLMVLITFTAGSLRKRI